MRQNLRAISGHFPKIFKNFTWYSTLRSPGGYSRLYDTQLRSVLYQVKLFPNETKWLRHSDFGPDCSKINKTNAIQPCVPTKFSRSSRQSIGCRCRCPYAELKNKFWINENTFFFSFDDILKFFLDKFKGISLSLNHVSTGIL